MVQKKKNEQDKDSGEDKFAEFVSSTIRAPRQGVYEHLLSQFLASAVVVSDPLKRIKIVTEAAMMVPEREREDLAVNYETVESLNRVCIAFQNRIVRKDYWIVEKDAFKPRCPPFELVTISWGFPDTEENYKRHIAPWYRTRIWLFPSVVVMMHHYKDEAEFNRQPMWKRFFDASRCLPVTSYQSMKTEFVTYAMPKIQLMLAELTRLVQPSLYANILGLYTKKRSYAEKVSEVAKGTAPTEELLDQR